MKRQLLRQQNDIENGRRMGMRFETLKCLEKNTQSNNLMFVFQIKTHVSKKTMTYCF